MSKVIREILPVGATLLGVTYFALSWSALPDTVPIHFGLLGQPDGWAPKGIALLLPVVAVFNYGMLWLAEVSNKFNLPWKITDANREQINGMARNLLFALRLQTSLLIAYIQFALVQTAMHRMDGLGAWFAPVFIGSIFLTIAIFFVMGNRVAAKA